MKRFALLALAACASTAPLATPPTPVATAAPPPPPSSWAEDTRSPRSTAENPGDDRAAQLLEACGPPDAALMRVAAGETSIEIEPALRELGSPYVRPTLLQGVDDPPENDRRAMPQLEAMLRSRHTDFTRCGVSVAGDRLNVVSVEALADLGPLPVRSRTGAWLTLNATLHIPAASAKVVVHGPRGAPKTYPTTIDRAGHTHARFVLDHPGEFTVQLVADVTNPHSGDPEGPRPVVEALVFADVPPTHATPTAPGEREPSLEAMVAAVRKEEGLSPLKRDRRLDALASAHVERMQKAGRIAHDLGTGDGDFAQRFQTEGLAATVVGENVARAETLPLAHRKLYASPSHRLNLLNAQYTRLGLATLTEGTRVWVCEVFSSDLQ